MRAKNRLFVGLLLCLGIVTSAFSQNIDIAYGARYTIEGDWALHETDISDVAVVKDFIDASRSAGVFFPDAVTGAKTVSQFLTAINSFIINGDDDNAAKRTAFAKYLRSASEDNSNLAAIVALKLNNRYRTDNDDMRFRRYIVQAVGKGILPDLNVDYRGTWQWTIYPMGDKTGLSDIRYRLPEFFPSYVRDNEVNLHKTKEQIAWSEPLILYFASRFELTMEASFGQNQKPTIKRKYLEPALYTYSDPRPLLKLTGNVSEWTISVSSDLPPDGIDFVEYTFVPATDQSVVISENSTKAFSVSGHGEGFTVQARIVNTYGSVRINQIKVYFPGK